MCSDRLPNPSESVTSTPSVSRVLDEDQPLQSEETLLALADVELLPQSEINREMVAKVVFILAWSPSWDRTQCLWDKEKRLRDAGRPLYIVPDVPPLTPDEIEDLAQEYLEGSDHPEDE